MQFLMSTILWSFYFFTAFAFIYIVFKIINNRFVNNIYKKNLSLILLSIILNLWLIYLLIAFNRIYHNHQNIVFMLYDFVFFLFVIVVIFFLNQFHTITSTIIGTVYILIKNQTYGILILIPFILILFLIILESSLIKNKIKFLKNQLSLIFTTISIPLLLVVFLLVTTLKYNISYANDNVILSIIVIIWMLSLSLTMLVLNFINKVFLNLDNIYNKSLFATAGLFQSGIAPKIIKHYLQSENVKLAYLFVFQQETHANFLQHHADDKDELTNSTQALVNILNLKNKQNIKNKEVKFKIDEKHFGLLLKINKVDDLTNKYSGNFLKSRHSNDNLLIYQNVIDQFNKKLTTHQFNCGVAIYGIHNYAINQLIEYSKFAIHWSKLKKLDNNIQVFNHQNLFNFDNEKNKIKTLKQIFSLYSSNDSLNISKIKNSNDAVLLYNIRNQYKFKSFFNKNLTSHHLLANDFKRYTIYQKLKQLQADNKFGIKKLYFEYPWTIINQKSFDIKTMINNLLRTSPNIKKSIIFNIGNDDFKNVILAKNIAVFQNYQIPIVFDVTEITNPKKIIKIINFYHPNAIINNESDNIIDNIKTIIKSKNKYYYL